MSKLNDKMAGDTVGVGAYRGIAYQVIVGNDVEGTGIFRQRKRYRTLITQSLIEGKRQYACHVIKTKFMPSRITEKRIYEAVESWKECIDESFSDY